MKKEFIEDIHANIRSAVAHCSDAQLERLQDALSLLQISVGCFRRRNRTQDCVESIGVHERDAFIALKRATKILEEI